MLFEKIKLTAANFKQQGRTCQNRYHSYSPTKLTKNTFLKRFMPLFNTLPGKVSKKICKPTKQSACRKSGTFLHGIFALKYLEKLRWIFKFAQRVFFTSFSKSTKQKYLHQLSVFGDSCKFFVVFHMSNLNIFGSYSVFAFSQRPCLSFFHSVFSLLNDWQQKLLQCHCASCYLLFLSIIKCKKSGLIVFLCV